MRPTRVSRKGEAALVTYHQYLVYEKPRTFDYTISGAYYSGLDTLPDYQNIAAPFKEYETLSGRLDYHDLRKTLLIERLEVAVAKAFREVERVGVLSARQQWSSAPGKAFDHVRHSVGEQHGFRKAATIIGQGRWSRPGVPRSLAQA